MVLACVKSFHVDAPLKPQTILHQDKIRAKITSAKWELQSIKAENPYDSPKERIWRDDMKVGVGC